MTKNNKKKTAREKRILVGAFLTAVVIAAGSTFAWFTSKDEVTNRLSASAKYDVSIAEDFQPPEEWLPGQKVNKDVSAVNTGNVDAFVRMWLGGQMRLLNEETDTTKMVDIATSAGITETNKPSSGLTAVTDEDMLALGLTWQKAGTGENATPVYYRTLSTKKISNANDENHAGTLNEDTNIPGMFSEVQSMMAGGVLVYAPANAGYHWTLEQAAELPVYTAASGDTAADTTMTNLAKGTVVGSSKSGETGVKTLAPLSDSDSNYYGAIDASTFQPETEGLYLFRRNVKETDEGTANTYEYSGYYYVPAVTTGDNQHDELYFALHTDTGANGKSDYVLPVGTINDNSTAEPSKEQVLPVSIAEDKEVYLYTVAEKVIDTGAANTNLIWKYNAPDASKQTDLEKNGYFTVTYNNNTTENTDDDIVINVALANISNAAEAWTAISGTTADHTTTFYYNNDVESGDTTTKLVDSVTLSDKTKNGAYLAFDFDLDVFLESVQVTMDEAGKELIDPAKAEFANATTVEGIAANTAITDASASMDTTNNAEIATITWTK